MSGAAHGLSRSKSLNEVLNLIAVDLAVQFLIESENSRTVKRAQRADNLFLGDVFVFMMSCFNVVVIISDAKIRIYLCAPNNLPIFFACGAIFLALHAEQHIIKHLSLKHI